MKASYKTSRHRGFSLIEMLTVVSIIGIMIAIIIPHFGSLTGEASTVKDRRNAQSIVSVYSTGAAAGVAWPAGNVATKVAAVMSGAQPSSGAFEGNNFKCDATTVDMALKTYRYIGITGDGDLIYDHSGAQNLNGQ